MRSYFNSAGLWEKVRQGDLAERLRRNGHPSPDRSGEPFCTRSQIVEYWDGEMRIAVVHQYLRNDGTIGAAGRPDPKWLRVDEEIWTVVPDSD